MEKLKINFADFWRHLDKEDNIFSNLLRTDFELKISDRPDILFCTNNNLGLCEYLKYKCIKVFIGLENQKADWLAYDYVIDFHTKPDNHRHFRFPLWALWDTNRLTIPKNPDEILPEKRKFCCMVVSNTKAKERIEFFHLLNGYKTVYSGGKYLNNTGGPVTHKLDFIKDYKFVISFENSSKPGYSTEKLIEPMFVNSIPVYWGDTSIGEQFNTESFVNLHDYSSWEEAVNRIIRLDQDEDAYRHMLLQPWFTGNIVPEKFSHDRLKEILAWIVNDSRTRKPACKTYKQYIHSILTGIQKMGHFIRKRIS